MWDSTHRMEARKKAGKTFNTANCFPQDRAEDCAELLPLVKEVWRLHVHSRLSPCNAHEKYHREQCRRACDKRDRYACLCKHCEHMSYQCSQPEYGNSHANCKMVNQTLRSVWINTDQNFKILCGWWEMLEVNNCYRNCPVKLPRA